MPEKLVDENVLNLYKDGMASMRLTLGRNFIAHLPAVKQECPNCLWDSVNKTSAGKFSPTYPYPSGIPGPKEFKGRCPVCKGVGELDAILQQKRIKGICYWLKGPDREVTVAGKTYYVDVEISNINIRYYDTVESADHFTIDDMKVFLAAKPTKEGLRDLIKFTSYFTYGREI